MTSGIVRRIMSVCVLLLLVSGVAQAQDDTLIVIGWEQEPRTLPPLDAAVFSRLTQDFYSRNVWDWDQDYNPYPIMVTAIPSIENGLVTTNDEGHTVVTYQLKPDLKWSDGEAITADDCLFGHRLYSDRNTGTISRNDYPQVVESVEKIDELTVVQTFNTLYPDFVSDSVYLPCRFPQHVLEPLMEANGGTIDGLPYFTNAEGVVGYGPYRLESWVKGESITFVKNPYWDGQEPAIARVILKMIPDVTQIQNALETGEIDLAFNWLENLAAGYAAIPEAALWSTTSPLQDALWFNIREGGTQNPALLDLQVRQAIVHAINRQVITEALLGAGTPIPAAYDLPRWQPDDLTVLEYDPERANQLLNEAGWVDSNDNGVRDKDGVELVLRVYTTTRKLRQDYQLAIQQDLSAVGISTQLFSAPGPQVLFASYPLRGILARGDYDLAIYSAPSDPISPNIDPDAYTCGMVPSDAMPDGGNWSGYCDPAFDELVEAIRSNPDPVSRLEQKHESVRLFTDAVFWAGLFPRLNNYAVNGERFDVESMKTVGTSNTNWFNHVEYWQPK